MKVKRSSVVIVFLLALVMSFALIACGGNNKPTPTTQQYTVTFNANGGTLTGNSTVKVDKDGKITGAPTAAKDNSTFDGWFEAATGGTALDLATYTVTKDVTLYAHYTENGTVANRYTVTFNANGGVLTGNATVKVDEGGKITGAPTAAKENSTFDGWFETATGGTALDLATYTVTKDVTLYAHYTANAPKQVTVTFNANGGELEGNGTQSVNVGSTVTAPAATRGGHRFDGWYDAATAGNKVDVATKTFDADTTLYARWVKVWSVTFDSNGGLLEGNRTVDVDEGKALTGVPTASKPGVEFKGWFDSRTDGNAINLDAYVPTADITLYAQYDASGVKLSMPVTAITGGYRIEAEDAQIEGTPSYAGNNFVENDITSASGNKAVGSLSTVGNTVTFAFNSSAAGTATVKILAASNVMAFSANHGGGVMFVDDQTVTNSDITVSVNGTNVTFSPTLVRGAGEDEPMTWNKYFDPIDLGTINIAEGYNTIVLTAASTTVPNLDCIDLTTTLTLTSAQGGSETPAEAYDKDVTLKMIVTGYAGGPAVSKAVIGFTEDIQAGAVSNNPFNITVGSSQLGTRGNDKAYLSDADGNELPKADVSRYVTVEFDVTYGSFSFNGNLAAFTYNSQTNRNSWNDYTAAKVNLGDLLLIGDKAYSSIVANKVTASRVAPDLDDWDLTGTYTKDDITLKYASFAPAANPGKTGKKPIIIWLHGAGEGGTDPSIAILGNQVTSLSKDIIQKYFVTDTVAGAYVLAPQSPTMWMDNGNGQQGGSDVGESIYTEALFGLIEKFVNDHEDIDKNRVYLGGCSNGGWMTVEMLSKHGEFFAAAYPIAVPFDMETMPAEDFNRLKAVPMWITHAKADTTVSIGTITTGMSATEFNGYTNENSNELYLELLKAGAQNVYYSLFDTVTLDGVTYMGHWSWIYTLLDMCDKVQAKTGADGGAFALTDFDETSTLTVQMNGENVTLWKWLAAQVKA